jgi:two-component system sensor histidine kinase/response regulator
MQLNQTINKLIGNPDLLPIQARLLHGISLLSVFAALCLSLSMFIYGNINLGFSFLILGASFSLSYYLGFHFRKIILSQWIFILSMTFIANLSFSQEVGIGNPSFYGLVIGFFLSQLCAPDKRWKIVYYVYFILIGLWFIFLKSPSVTTLESIYFLGYMLFTGVLYFGLDLLMKAYDSMALKAIADGVRLKKSNILIKEQLEEMRSSNEQKDRLFSIIGHDLRNPLNGIEGFIELLEENEINPETQKEFRTELLKLTRGSRTLLDNLLEWSRRDAKAYNIKGVSVKDIADRVSQTVEGLAKTKELSLYVLVNAEDPKVLADEQVLELTLRNIITNAIKFTRPDGWIKLRSYEFQDSIHIEVEDNGMGMEQRQVDRIFTKGREIREGTANEKGVGLGLLLCYEFIQKMKGQIRVRSKVGKGTCFTIILTKEKQ